MGHSTQRITGITDSENGDGVKRFALKGNLDEELSSQLEKSLLSGSIPADQKVILDFAEVPMVTPDGIRVLLNTSFQFDEGALIVENPNNDVQQLLRTVGLESLVKTS